MSIRKEAAKILFPVAALIAGALSWNAYSSYSDKKAVEDLQEAAAVLDSGPTQSFKSQNDCVEQGFHPSVCKQSYEAAKKISYRFAIRPAYVFFDACHRDYAYEDANNQCDLSGTKFPGPRKYKPISTAWEASAANPNIGLLVYAGYERIPSSDGAFRVPVRADKAYANRP